MSPLILRQLSSTEAKGKKKQNTHYIDMATCAIPGTVCYKWTHICLDFKLSVRMTDNHFVAAYYSKTKYKLIYVIQINVST